MEQTTSTTIEGQWPSNPTDFCNWLIPQKLLIGGYPYPRIDYRINHLDKLLALGVNAFISLVEDHEIVKFGDYSSILARHNSSITYSRYPIRDRSITSDDILFNLVERIFKLPADGKLVYIHCWGGHGRAGTFACCFLQRFYRITAEKAIQHNRQCHSTRKHNPNKPTPQGQKQYAQIRRYQKYLLSHQLPPVQ